MDTYTIAAAARLVGAPKGTLYQAIRAGRLQAAPRQEPGQALTVTAAALQAAGFTVPAAALPSPPAESAPAAPLAPAAEVPPSPGPAPALIAHLERALEQAHARELRLLDLLAQFTGQRSTPLVSEPPVAPPARTPAAAPHPAATPPLRGLRQQIVAVLREHPEGLSPKAVQTLLQLDTDMRSTMKGMVHSGLLTRLEAGRYVVAAAGAER